MRLIQYIILAVVAAVWLGKSTERAARDKCSIIDVCVLNKGSLYDHIQNTTCLCDEFLVCKQALGKSSDGVPMKILETPKIA